LLPGPRDDRGPIAERDQPDVGSEVDRDDVHDQEDDRADDDEWFVPDDTDTGRRGRRDDRRRDRDAGDRRREIGRERERADRTGSDRDRQCEQARRDERRHLIESGNCERRRNERGAPDEEAHPDRAEKRDEKPRQLGGNTVNRHLPIRDHRPDRRRQGRPGKGGDYHCADDDGCRTQQEAGDRDDRAQRGERDVRPSVGREVLGAFAQARVVDPRSLIGSFDVLIVEFRKAQIGVGSNVAVGDDRVALLGKTDVVEFMEDGLCAPAWDRDVKHSGVPRGGLVGLEIGRPHLVQSIGHRDEPVGRHE